MGRPAHLPEPSQRRRVEAMAGYGVPEADIALVLGIDPKTLRKHYRAEFDKGQIIASTRVAAAEQGCGSGRSVSSKLWCWIEPFSSDHYDTGRRIRDRQNEA